MGPGLGNARSPAATARDYTWRVPSNVRPWGFSSGPRERGAGRATPDRQHGLDHVVVLMFENRSFDHLLGRLYQPGEVESFEGILGKDLSNPIPEWAEHGAERGVVDYGVASWRLFDASVVERDVEVTELLDRLLDDGLDVAGGGHVGGVSEMLLTVLTDQLSGLCIAGCVDVGQDHFRAFGREGYGRGAADAAARTGHKRDLPANLDSAIFGLTFWSRRWNSVRADPAGGVDRYGRVAGWGGCQGYRLP
jgi:hypothetical protein